MFRLYNYFKKEKKVSNSLTSVRCDQSPVVTSKECMFIDFIWLVLSLQPVIVRWLAVYVASVDRIFRHSCSIRSLFLTLEIPSLMVNLPLEYKAVSCESDELASHPTLTIGSFSSRLRTLLTWASAALHLKLYWILFVYMAELWSFFFF